MQPSTSSRKPSLVGLQLSSKFCTCFSSACKPNKPWLPDVCCVCCSIEDPSAWKPGEFEVKRRARGVGPIPFDMRDRSGWQAATWELRGGELCSWLHVTKHLGWQGQLLSLCGAKLGWEGLGGVWLGA